MNGRFSIDPLSCKGLGECISKCPERAISLSGSTDEEIYARIDGCLSSGRSKVIAFLDEKIAYVAADNMGVNRVEYLPEVRIIKVPSVMRLESKHLVYAFKKGAAGVFVGDGTANASGSVTHEVIVKRVEGLKEGVALADMYPERICFYEAYLPHFKGLAKKLDEFSEMLNSAYR